MLPFRPIACLLALLFTLPAQAQYASVQEDQANQEAALEKKADQARQKYLGRTFWIVPNPSAITRQQFIESFGRNMLEEKKFVVTEPVKFTVSGFLNRYPFRFVEVTFDDGKVAHLAEYGSFAANPNDTLFDNVLSPTQRQYDFVEYILPMSPEDMAKARSRQRGKEKAAAVAWKARGGVSVGMTADQVRQSNWGRPESINRTTGSYGVQEQWVYGGGNYVYLKNGRVTAIQN